GTRVPAPLSRFYPLDFKDCLECEVCGAVFETRRGLSSHARYHLRQLGVTLSDSSGAPIDLLYQLAKEGALDESLLRSPSGPPPAKKHHHQSAKSRKGVGPKARCKAAADDGKGASLPGRSVSPSPLVRSRSASPVLRSAPVSSLLPASSPLRSSEPKGTAARTVPSSHRGGAKPLWAPQDTDAPLNLALDADPTKDIVCELCGAWFETRKGLASHARAHLRHLGVLDADSKGSPIDGLHQLIRSEDFRRRLASLDPKEAAELCLAPSSSSSKTTKRSLSRVSSPGGSKVGHLSTVLPLSKYPLAQAHGAFVRFTAGDLVKEVECEFCGEFFENRKGLSSHARSHLRQMGVTEWTVNGSPYNTLMEVVARRGLSCAVPPRTVTSPRLSPGPPVLSPPASPSSPGALKRLTSTLDSPRVGVSLNLSATALFRSFSVSAVKAQEPDPLQEVQCEFCGESFENRKGLSSHARSHLRQMGVTEWTVNGSPIDTLVDVVRKKGARPAVIAAPRQVPAWPRPVEPQNASCELCGFCFENRKALASHARAHLRQFGVTEWRVNGSPIETLHAWIRKEPRRVAEMQRRWAQGGPPRPKKQKSSSFLVSLSHPGGSLARSQKPLSSGASGHRVGREVAGGVAGSSRSADGRFHGRPSLQHGHGNRVAARRGDTLLQSQAAHSQLNVRSPRGFERRPPKHLVSSEGREQESGSSQAPRTGTVPALVPKPPSTPLVKVVGDVYSLRCRFCEVEFRGPLSVQEDWVRHLQRHILGLNFNKRDPPAPPPRADAAIAPASAIAAEAPAPGPASGPSPGPAPGPPLPPASPLAPSPTLAAAPVSVPASVPITAHAV
uniref:C2H2-type domain-containing protein n=1 Tax=Scleropages formosus TaxID=113540 RepID=A0A8C9RC44_SCLFO